MLFQIKKNSDKIAKADYSETFSNSTTLARGNMGYGNTKYLTTKDNIGKRGDRSTQNLSNTMPDKLMGPTCPDKDRKGAKMGHSCVYCFEAPMMRTLLSIFTKFIRS